MVSPSAIAPPGNYPQLPFKQIRLSNHPSTSRTPTQVIVLTLYRPDKHNAFTATMTDELVEAFSLLDADDRVKCVVMTGYGKMFCAGSDLDVGFHRSTERPDDHRDGGGRVALAINKCRKPVIGAIQGSAVGIGATMTLPMSIRVALNSAKIGFVFSRRGIVMEACSSFFLPRLIGMARAIHLTTTGLAYRADDKLLDGLFSATYDTPAQVLDAALKIADDVAANTSVVSTYLMREMMYRDTGSAEGQHLLDSKLIYDMFGAPDCKEGVTAFMEKRPARFSGTLANNAPSAYPWWTAPDIKSRHNATSSKAKL